MADEREPTLYNRRQAQPRGVEMQRTGGGAAPANLADILERVLDKGIVIAGDIQINLLDIELLTIKLRLLIASVERAQEMGINWWESDPTLSANAHELEEENRELRERLDRLEKAAGLPAPREGEEVIFEEHRREEIVAGNGVEREEKEMARHEDVIDDEVVDEEVVEEEVVDEDATKRRATKKRGTTGVKDSNRG